MAIRKSLLTKDHIFETALRLAENEGFNNITRDGIALAASVSVGLVSHYFGTMTKLKRSIMRAAIKRKLLSIVGTGLVLKDKTALKAPEHVKIAALKSLQ